MIQAFETLFPTFWHVLGFIAVLLVLFTLAASFIGAREMAEGFDLEEDEQRGHRPEEAPGERLQAAARDAMGSPLDERNTLTSLALFDDRPSIGAFDARMRTWPEWKWRHGEERTREAGL